MPRFRLLVLALIPSVALLLTACFGGGSAQNEPASPGDTPPAATPAPSSTQRTVAAIKPDDALVAVTYLPPFVWPAEGPLTSFMGPDHPDGIDIGLDAGGSKSVYAAASGTTVFAGGDDDEPLGISIVISHTNGITTTYGHLEELLVDEGDQVVVGQAIGIGGSTGNSSGDHLHFELRRDGHTIDPLDVLTVDVSTPPRLWIDCQALSFTVPGGAEARLDFRELLAPRERIVRARAVPAGDAGSLAAAIQDGFQVRVQTPLDFAGPDRLQAYSLDLTVDSPAENYTLSCPFAVQYRNVPTTFYVRAAPDTEEVAATMLEPPAPTPTQGPSPHYGVPSSTGFEAASPEFNSPRIASPGGQSPQYGLPGAPSPTPQP